MTSLALLLSIPALSKVQLNHRSAIRDATIYSVAPAELPFWYFQRVVNRMLELRSPSGYMVRVAATDVCDIVPAEPVVVQAMPKEVFVERLKLPVRERCSVAPAECYQPAHVLWVTKDKWHRVDSVFVRFVDERYNSGVETWSAPIDVASRDLLNRDARRDRMPVADRSSKANWSAVSSERPQEREARKEIGKFFAAALAHPRKPSAGLSAKAAA